MTQTMSYRQMGATDRGQAHTLFAQTMGYVAMTAALFALGAWAGHNLTGGVGIVVNRRFEPGTLLSLDQASTHSILE